MTPFATWLSRQWHRHDNVGWLSTWLFRFGDEEVYPAAPTTLSDWGELLVWAAFVYAIPGEAVSQGFLSYLDGALNRAWVEWRMWLNGQDPLPHGLRGAA
jgi:hypothetical protein